MYNFNEQSESTELIGGFRPVACDSGGIVSTIFKLIWIPDVFKTCHPCGSKDNVMQLMSELVWILEHQICCWILWWERKEKGLFAQFKPKLSDIDEIDDIE